MHRNLRRLPADPPASRFDASWGLRRGLVGILGGNSDSAVRRRCRRRRTPHGWFDIHSLLLQDADPKEAPGTEKCSRLMGLGPASDHQLGTPGPSKPPRTQSLARKPGRKTAANLAQNGVGSSGRGLKTGPEAHAISQSARRRGTPLARGHRRPRSLTGTDGHRTAPSP